MRVDPGRHRFSVESDGAEVTIEAISSEGVKLQRVEAVFPAPPAPAPPPPAPPRQEAPPPPRPAERPLPVAPIVAAAVGVVAFGSFAFFGARALSQSSDLHAHPGTYTQSDIDSLKTKIVVADTSLGIGIVATAIAVVLWLGRGTSAPPTSAALGRSP
jgi:hypothetical protein